MRAFLNFFVLPGLGLASGFASAAISLDGLATDSPFVLKRAESATPVVTENATVEFRGMIATKDGVLFGLYDRTRNASAWVKQNESGADFVVRAFDAAGDMVTVDYQGQKLTLPLSAAKIGAAAPTPVQVANVPSTTPVQPAIARVNDQQRLESVAAEVRRRRALRQAATSGTPAPAATNAPRQ